ncbi:MAG: hypothetical protein CMO01_11915 [Thalassobius sp.]|nr:hypothetical protein [Thalassovita sp.]|tara:strand:+ start:51926 stop:52339 length:414 start_codon:yes stop_codon:yes gene_type:complete
MMDSVVENSMLVMGAKAFISSSRLSAKDEIFSNNHKRLVAGSEPLIYSERRVDTETLVSILDQQYITMRKKIFEREQTGEHVNHHLTYVDMKHRCNTRNYLLTLQALAKDVGVEICLEHAKDHSRFFKMSVRDIETV